MEHIRQLCERLPSPLAPPRPRPRPADPRTAQFPTQPLDIPVPKREFMRRGINQHTLEKICRKEAVRAIKLAKVFKILQQWESEQQAADS
jgi:hypothetical protein